MITQRAILADVDAGEDGTIHGIVRKIPTLTPALWPSRSLDYLPKCAMPCCGE